MKSQNKMPITLAVISLITIPLTLHAQECGMVITQDTTLTSDIESCTGDGIIIGNSGVTLDLNGHTISGARKERSNGILAEGVTDITIVNGTVQSFEDGVSISNSDNVLITGINSNFNRNYGLLVYNSSNVRLFGNKVTSNTLSGINTLDSDVRMISNRAESNSLYGIAMTGTGPTGKLLLINNVSINAGTRTGFLFTGGFTNGTAIFKANRAFRHLGYGFQFAEGGMTIDAGGNIARGNTLGPCYPEDACPLTLQ